MNTAMTSRQLACFLRIIALGVVLNFAPLNISAFGQGSLTPPGAPAPTMKTLTEVEPRMPLSDTNTPGDADFHYVISQPGSYYLTTNLPVTKTGGIAIRARGVTLDLNGFTVQRASGSGGNGIEAQAGAYECIVRDGTVRGFGFGILIPSSAGGGRFEGLSASHCSIVGLQAGASWILKDCFARSNSVGIKAGYGSSLERCVVTFSSDIGIEAGADSTLALCSAVQGSGAYGILVGRGCTVNQCTVGDNTVPYGVYAGISSVISRCSVYRNTTATSSGFGIYTETRSVVESCAVSQITSTYAVAENDTTDNGVGIFVDSNSTVRDCTVAVNEGDGIRSKSDCLIQDNNSANNGNNGNGAAIRVDGLGTVVKGNLVKDSDVGVAVDLGSNLIIGNTAQGNTINYVIVTSNKVGTIVSSPASGAISGSTGGAGVGTTDPWANLSF